MPSAELMESMRAVGYSLETALADLVDNALAAHARNIWIYFEAKPVPHVAILDDGSGMSKETLRNAMKLAGRSPIEARASDDLGRFGLGLKTASLSQCRSLSVTSKLKDADATTANWDLDFIRLQGDWVLRWIMAEDLPKYDVFDKMRTLKSGTLVLWEKLDLMLGGAGLEVEDFSALTKSTAEHLSLVFHRYMQQVAATKVHIYVNNAELKPRDPFLESHRGTHGKDEIKVTIKGQVVRVKPFILPPLNKLSHEERESAMLQEGLRDTQGFYIYRNKRLLTYGTWFRLVAKTELSKLARVRVDTPNTLDDEWRLGIMKSSVQPPKSLRARLATLVPRIISDSRKVSRAKSILSIGSMKSAWVINELGDGAFTVNVNTDYPLLAELVGDLDPSRQRKLANWIEALESLFPFTEVMDRFTDDRTPTVAYDQELVRNLFLALLALNGNDVDKAFNALLSTPPISDHPAYIEEVKNKREQIAQEDKGTK